MLFVHFYVQPSGLIRNQFMLNVFAMSCFYLNEPQSLRTESPIDTALYHTSYMVERRTAERPSW